MELIISIWATQHLVASCVGFILAQDLASMRSRWCCRRIEKDQKSHERGPDLIFERFSKETMKWSQVSIRGARPPKLMFLAIDVHPGPPKKGARPPKTVVLAIDVHPWPPAPWGQIGEIGPGMYILGGPTPKNGVLYIPN